jgi:anthranilate phosphoribosyltransferase
MTYGLQHALAAAVAARDLTREEMSAAMEEIIGGEVAREQVAGLLIALRMKGETVDELVGAATVMRRHIQGVNVEMSALIDTCGTGGDGCGTFNISTTAAIVAAAGGATVAKHGNRSVSSQCGSADLLEALGVAVDHQHHAEECLKAIGIAFFFAPNHHPAFRHVAPVRAALGVRTMFNLLGPLLNPAAAKRQVMGVYDGRLVELVAGALAELGSDHALVVHGDGTDEIAVSGETVVSEVRDGKVHSTTRLQPEDLGLSRWSAAELRGGDAGSNAAITRAVLSGAAGAPRDAVLANAGAALYVAGLSASIRDGVGRAAEAVDTGAAERTLAEFVRMSNEP